MQLILQPEGSSLCGQCVVAMLSGISLDHAIEQMGDGRNYPRDIRRELSKLGVSIPNRSEESENGRGPKGVKAAALLYSTIEDNRTYTHWIAWDGKQWFDPRIGKYEDFREHYKATAAVYAVETQ